jgi:outer membrane lipoprotein-sorting protein
MEESALSEDLSMSRLLSFVCALVLLLGVVPLAAQTPSVDDLLAKNTAARGGADKLKAISTRKVAGTVAVQGMEMPMVVLAKRPNLMLQEMQVQGRRVVTAFDGEQAWAINPMLGGDAPQKLEGVQADLIRDQAQFDGPLAYARQRGDKMEVVGKEQVEGADAWKLAITRGDKVTHVFLDENTGLERKISATITNGGTQLLIESIISDYQPTDGLMVPRKIQTLVGGQAQAAVTIDTVEFNVPIEDEKFKMPASTTPAPPK